LPIQRALIAFFTIRAPSPLKVLTGRPITPLATVASPIETAVPLFVYVQSMRPRPSIRRADVLPENLAGLPGSLDHRRHGTIRVGIDDRLPDGVFRERADPLVLVHQCRIAEDEYAVVLGFEPRPGVDAIVVHREVGAFERALAGDPTGLNEEAILRQ